jgi:hypothetical protein
VYKGKRPEILDVNFLIFLDFLKRIEREGLNQERFLEKD